MTVAYLSLWRGVRPRRPSRANLVRLLEAVAVEYGVTVEDITGPLRTSWEVEPRHAFCWRAHQEGYSFPAIALAIKRRDHTTVMHACKAHAKRLIQDIAA